MTVGWLVYGLVPEGNIGAIYLATVLFSLVMSGLGVSIANQSSTMLQSIFVMFAFIMIFQLMSGLFTPIRSMPQWAQYLTYAIPQMCGTISQCCVSGAPAWLKVKKRINAPI